MSKVITVKSVDRALCIIEKLKENSSGMGVTDLSTALGVSKSTIHRLLMSLNVENYVSQEPSTGKYLLGLKFIEIGELVSENLDIRKVTSSFLKELASRTQETVHLVIMEKNEVVYIDKVESPATVRMYSRVGKRTLMHCTGVGKVFLANLPTEVVQSILMQQPMVGFTKNTIISKEELLKQLKLIKKNGYAFDDEEHEEGVKCIAAPIKDYNGNVIAAISIAIPTLRWDNRKFDFFVDEVKKASLVISKSFGYKMH